MLTQTHKSRGLGELSRAAVLVTVASVGLFGQSQGGQINGRVVDGANRPIAGALVIVKLSVAPAGADPRFLSIARSGKDGSFSINGVPAGTFEICPQVQGSDLLAPCMWGSPPSITLARDETATAPPITLLKGAHLKVRIDGSTAQIAALGGGKSDLEVWITGPRLMDIPAALTKRDVTGQEHDALVPFDKPVSVRVFSKAVTLADDKGNAIDGPSGGVPVTIPSGTESKQVTLSVTGVKK